MFWNQKPFQTRSLSSRSRTGPSMLPATMIRKAESAPARASLPQPGPNDSPAETGRGGDAHREDRCQGEVEGVQPGRSATRAIEPLSR